MIKHFWDLVILMGVWMVAFTNHNDQLAIPTAIVAVIVTLVIFLYSFDLWHK